jgi:hypothetical protein
MPVIAGNVDFDVLSNPRGSVLLRGFDVGDGRYDKQVTKMVRELGSTNAHGAKAGVLTHNGNAAAICAWYPRPLVASNLASPDDVYIHLVGVSRDHRECRLEDGTWLSRALMLRTLEQVQAESPGGVIRASWTLVAPFNRKSHRLFRYNGYSTRAPVQGHDLIRLRPAGLEIRP